jgi:acyl-CoA synthetase (AMP-forming)/AMP-acid ligase II
MWASSYQPLEAESATLPDLVCQAAARLPKQAALIDARSGHAVSYATLATRIERVAAGLAARGFGTGDVLAVQAPNIAPWAGVALGAMAAGGAVTGVSPRATRRELSAQLADSGASTIVTIPRLVEDVQAVAADTAVREVIAIGEAPGATPIADLLSGDTPAPTLAPDPDRVAFLPYSSGTTGLPKAVMLTHGNLVAAVRQFRAGLRPTDHDTFLALAPFAHVMGFVVSLVTPLAAGASVATLDRFTVDGLVSAIELHRVTVLPVAPQVFAALAPDQSSSEHDLSSLELIVSGGAPLGREIQQAVATRFPRATVAQGYGLTETSALIPVPDRNPGAPPGSTGTLAPCTELRVIDPDTDCDLGPGERGELWVRGPQVMGGYLHRPDATAEMVDPEGWLRTGDLGYVDDDGHVFIVDRLKELIKVNAYQVAPAELEALLATHPRVADAAVVPRPDDVTGQAPVAVVVANGALDPDELIAWVADRVSPHKRIRDVRLVEQIPRTPSGKILRRRLVGA